MNKALKKSNTTNFYKITNTKDFLGLTTEELELIDLKITLIKMVKNLRIKNNLTQIDLAKLIKSSQSRVAMIETNSPDVSLDLICKALFALGADNNDIAKAIKGSKLH